MRQIRYFLAVCETLNFTRAAEHCHVTQPALTRAIRKLEDELGGALFRRERHLTHLTDLGRLLRPQFAQIWRQTEAARTTAKSFLVLDEAPLQLGLMSTIGPRRSADFIGRFSRQHRGIGIELREGGPRELAAQLRQGALDVAVMTPVEPRDRRLNVRPLYRERFMVAFPPGHHFAAMERVRLAELDGERCLVRSDCEILAQLERLCAGRGIALHHACLAGRDSWIQTMVMAGAGITLLPECSLLLPDLPARPLVEPRLSREVALVTVAGRRFSPAVAAFVQAVRSHVAPDVG